MPRVPDERGAQYHASRATASRLAREVPNLSNLQIIAKDVHPFFGFAMVPLSTLHTANGTTTKGETSGIAFAIAVSEALKRLMQAPW